MHGTSETMFLFKASLKVDMITVCGVARWKRRNQGHLDTAKLRRPFFGQLGKSDPALLRISIAVFGSREEVSGASRANGHLIVCKEPLHPDWPAS